MLTALEEKILNWQRALDAGEKDNASDREKADLKLALEEYLGLQQRGPKVRSRGGFRARKRAVCET
jgi:hypothetical protein